MTALLVPIALDVLVVRDPVQRFAPTKMATPSPAAQNAKRQQLLPPPFQPDQARQPGAYLHWALPDGLTHTVHDGVNPPIFLAIPQRWLIIRMIGDVTAGPRTLTAWLLPDVNAQQPVTMADVLGQPAPAPTTLPPAGTALTVLGQGDVSWSAYFDNVTSVLALYDPLDGVSGAVSYLVCGWYGNLELDPMQVSPAVSDATVFDKLDEFGWSLPGEDAQHDSAAPNPIGPNLPTSVICHGAAVALGWPTATWPGDGGTLAVEAGGSPDPAAVSIALADTIVEAAAVLGVTVNGEPGDPTGQLLLQATMAGMLSQLAQPDGPAKLDTAQHAARFVTLASSDSSETIWQPSIVTPPGSDGSTGAAVSPTASRQPAIAPSGLIAAVRASEQRAGVAAPMATGPDDDGSLVSADRSTPRVFAPTDPVIVLSGAQRSFNHGGDTRFGTDMTLQCRLSPSTVTWAGTVGSVAPDLTTLLPSAVAGQLASLGVPADVFSLLVETTMLDPSGAPDLADATSTQPSPIAAARAGWLTDPDTLPPLVQGVLPSPVGIIGAVHPWTPMHLEWALDWQPANAGVNAFTLGDVDFVTPDSTDLPVTTDVVPLFTGRSLLSASPARIAAGGAQAALALLRSAGLLDAHPFAERMAATMKPLAEAGGAARTLGAVGAVSDQDLLSGSLEDFLAALRGQDTSPIVRPTGTTSTPDSPATSKNVVRAGLARLQRARVVDAFGQYVDLVGSSATTTADQTRVLVGGSQAVDGEPGLMALLPRFNAPARVMLRYNDAAGNHQDASTAISPLCGFVVPSALDGSLEFFDATGLALGRLRPDAALGTVWEEDPGQPASAGRKPSESITNTFLGRFADGILAADAALAASSTVPLPQTALVALNQLIDSTRWTVDPTGTSGDEHLAMLLGHPVAVLRAGIKVDVQSVPATSNASTTSVPVKLGTLAHTQDGLLAYFVADDYSSAHAVDPAIGEIVPPNGSAITSPYIDLSPSFPIQPGAGVDLTLLATPSTDVHVTVGLLPQKSVGMRRDWVSSGLATLSPNWRYGPVLVDRKATRIPVAADVHGTWSWHRRSDGGAWATDTIVNANQTAIIPDDRVAVEYGWISLKLAPDPQFPGIPVQVSCITKPKPYNPRARIKGLGGTNGPRGSAWWMTLDSAIAMVETGRFFFYVQNSDKTSNPIVVDVSPAGNKFLRTAFDDITSNNLLSLPPCPLSS